MPRQKRKRDQNAQVVAAVIVIEQRRGTVVEMTSDESFSRKWRIRAAADFDRVFANGSVAMDTLLVVHAIRNEQGTCRLGVSLSRKVGTAPVRNRWKRVIREAFRRSKQLLPNGIDLVVRPRKGADCSYSEVQNSLVKLATRLAKKLESLP